MIKALLLAIITFMFSIVAAAVIAYEGAQTAVVSPVPNDAVVSASIAFN